jgi:hypothetical protein
MRFKLFVFCPNDEHVITAVIAAAAAAGAGAIGNYTHCAFITGGQGNWRAEPGAHPAIGQVGQMTRVAQVKIELRCPAEQAKAIVAAIRRVHPYEEPVIDVVRLEDV